MFILIYYFYIIRDIYCCICGWVAFRNLLVVHSSMLCYDRQFPSQI